MFIKKNYGFLFMYIFNFHKFDKPHWCLLGAGSMIYWIVIIILDISKKYKINKKIIMGYY